MKLLNSLPLKSSQAGDTIIEVLLAITIVSSVLAGAFVVVAENTRHIRDSEEHAQALQLLQGQVEAVRAKLEDSTAKTAVTDLWDPGKVASPQPFCIDVKDGSTLYSGASYNVSGNCKDVTTSNIPGTQGFFKITDTGKYNGQDNLYHFQVQWDNSDGTSTSNVELVYRVYPTAS